MKLYHFQIVLLVFNMFDIFFRSTKATKEINSLSKVFNEVLSDSELDKLLNETAGHRAHLYPNKNLIESKYVVVFKNNSLKRQVVDVLRNSKLPFDDKFHIHFNYELLPGMASTMNEKTLDIFRRLPQVKYVQQVGRSSIVDISQRDLICTTQANSEWCLSRITNENSVPPFSYKHSVFGGFGVTVYVLDTGMNISHPDLNGRATHGPSFVNNEGPEDQNGHGTAIASMVAGVQSGVAKHARIVSVKVLDASGQGDDSDIMAGIDYAASQPNADIINLSLGGAYNQAENDLLTNVINNGVFVVVAAGNEAVDACTRSPASTPLAYTVAAASINMNLAVFSNFGTCCDIIAPGVDCRCAQYNTGGYQLGTGTSIAAPMVSGWAAVEKTFLPFLTPALMTAQLNRKLKTGVILGNLKSTPNRFIHSTCPQL